MTLEEIKQRERGIEEEKLRQESKKNFLINFQFVVMLQDWRKSVGQQKRRLKEMKKPGLINYQKMNMKLSVMK